VPAFESKDGFKLFEGAAIARYLASLAPNTTLLGNSPQEAALVDQWNSFFDTEIDAPVGYVRRMLWGGTPYSKAHDQSYRERLDRPLETVENYIAKRTFLVGERLSLADITAATVLQGAYSSILGKAERAKYPHTIRYYETIVNQPKVKDVLAGAQLAEAAPQYAPLKTDQKPKADKQQAESKRKTEPKPPKSKAEPKPKEEEEEEEEEDLLGPAEPKKKNPLDDLPKSAFNLEDWKRAYSNLDTRGAGGSLEWFYEKFDKEGFSIWQVDFKYPEELTQVFMSSNQIGGFYNRLEGSRKYLFGSVGVLGAANDSLISGVLILRGHDHQAVVDVAPDWESYDYKRLDIYGNEEDKKYFEAALAWDLSVDGKAWADGKNFK